MLVRLLGLVLGIIGMVASAQVSDDFSDGDWSTKPTWFTSSNAGLGGNMPFGVEEGRLRLAAAPSNGKAWISTTSEIISQAQWEVDIHLDFNPSSSNLVRFYLASDKKELDQNLNGYFVQVGGTQDEVSLFRQLGTTTQKIIDGADGRVNQSFVQIKIKVTVDENGKWILYSDSGLTGIWTEEGRADDHNITSSAWTGFLCQFTSTRSDKFWFDNFSITGSKFPDRLPPNLTSYTFIDSLQLSITFSEPVDPIFVKPSNFSLPIHSIQLIDPIAIKLAFISPWVNGTSSPLIITGIRDLAGNVMKDTSIQLLYFRPGTISFHDVVINEVMPDPTPSVGLPQTEYVEIYNRSSNPVNLDGWVLSDGTQSAKLPQFILSPSGYAVLYPANAAPPLNSNNVLEIIGFPSLNNSADRILLYNQSGMIIDSLWYFSKWHRESGKADGGWSLERIDSNDLCGEEENWTSCEHIKGGTPGFINSVYAIRSDRTPPLPLASKVFGDQKIWLGFNEKMRPDSLQLEMLTIDPTLEWNGFRWEDGFRGLTINLKRPLEEGKLFTVRLKDVRDCTGNSVSPGGIKFRVAKPQLAELSDIVINEILFNPYPGGVDYVELYNRSNKYFQLEDWRLRSDTTSATSNFSQSSKLFGPGEYAVFTDDSDILKIYYPKVPDSVLLKTNLPSLPDDEGELFLRSPEGKWIDHVYYSKDFHLSLIRNEEGISLERLDPSSPGITPDNWRSSVSGQSFSGQRRGGTPGAPNANRFQVLNEIDDIRIFPEVFDPRKWEDGFTSLTYRFDRSDLFGSVVVLDWEGNRIKEIANNELLSQDGFFRWDGDDESGTLVESGFYLIVLEVHNAEGFYQVYRRRVVVAPG